MIWLNRLYLINYQFILIPNTTETHDTIKQEAFTKEEIARPYFTEFIQAMAV